MNNYYFQGPSYISNELTKSNINIDFVIRNIKNNIDRFFRLSTERLGAKCVKITKDTYDILADKFPMMVYSIKKFENFKEEDFSNYMFFKNLNTLKRMIDEMLKFEADNEMDELLNEHDWASDHISKATESLSHVYKFFLSMKQK